MNRAERVLLVAVLVAFLLTWFKLLSVIDREIEQLRPRPAPAAPQGISSHFTSLLFRNFF
jgi:hypothetical protein